MTRTANLKISAVHPLISPLLLEEDFPLSDATAQFIENTRSDVESILRGEDDRLLVIVGPCSIHDIRAAEEYARRLQPLAERYQQHLLIIMRVYFEKPRTTVGWKGLINDPDLNGSFHINKGLQQARQLLLYVNDLGLPAATEFLDTTFGQYYADLISLAAIGARTTESQVHRELASGLSMPVGFKNRTDGNVQVAADAILSSRQSHSFPSLTREGSPAIMETTGNPDCFLILRGGNDAPNYHRHNVEAAEQVLQRAGVDPAIVIDCSHGNSRKDYLRQLDVVDEICLQLTDSASAIRGVMIESHLQAGRQDVSRDKPLIYGQSITDACISWAETEGLLNKLFNALADSRRK